MMRDDRWVSCLAFCGLVSDVSVHSNVNGFVRNGQVQGSSVEVWSVVK